RRNLSSRRHHRGGAYRTGGLNRTSTWILQCSAHVVARRIGVLVCYTKIIWQDAERAREMWPCGAQVSQRLQGARMSTFDRCLVCGARRLAPRAPRFFAPKARRLALFAKKFTCCSRTKEACVLRSLPFRKCLGIWGRVRLA